MSDYISTADKIETPFSDDEIEKPDAAEDEDAPGLSPVERATRKERRTLRIKQKLDEGKQAKEELAKERQEKQQLAERLARLEGVVSTQQRLTQPAPVDPYQARLQAIRERQAREYNQLQAEIKAGTYTPEREKYYAQVSAEIEDEKGAVYTERALATRVPVIKQDVARQKWEDKYPQVYGNQQAYEFADATFRRRKALGEAVTENLVDEIMTETINTLKLPGAKRGPTDNERARLSGRPSSGGGGGNGGPTGGIQMTKELRRMAIAAYAGELGSDGKPLTEEQAVRKWVDGPGKTLRKEKVL